jgi:hypothetical protein
MRLYNLIVKVITVARLKSLVSRPSISVMTLEQEMLVPTFG